MANTLVSLRLPDEVLAEARSLAKKSGYANVQEFIRATVRDALLRSKLTGLGGTQKRSLLSKKSRDEALKSFFELKGWDYDGFMKERQ